MNRYGGADTEWTKKQYLLAWIFNVGRGNCAFIRTPSRDGILIDCGGGDEVIDGIEEYLLPTCREQALGDFDETRLAQVVISHPHVDHFLQIKRANALHPCFWTCPHDKTSPQGYPDERLDWELVSNPDGSGDLEEAYRDAYAKRRLPLQAFAPASEIPHFAYGLFYLPPPQCKPLEDELREKGNGLPKGDYANNVSIMAYFWFNGNSILFPGDMMPSGMSKSLSIGCENRLVGDGFAERFAKQSASAETFRKWVNAGCSILVAPHHGLESAYSPEFFRSLPAQDPRVGLVVISEKTEPGPCDGKVHPNYQNRGAGKVRGMQVQNQNGMLQECLSVTTRSQGHCLIGFRGVDDIGVVVSQDLEWILTDGPQYVFDR